MNNQICNLDKLIKVEYESSTNSEDEELFCLDFIKEENDFMVDSEDDKSYISELVKKEKGNSNEIYPITENICIQDDHDTNSENQTTILVYIKEEDELNTNSGDKSPILVYVKEEDELNTNSGDKSPILVFIKEEDELNTSYGDKSPISTYIKEEDTFVFNNEINNPKVETIANEDDTSMNPENINTSLLKLIKEEDESIEEDNNIYNSNTEVTSYGDEVSTNIEDNKSLLELIKEEHESEMQFPLSDATGYTNDIKSISENFELPFYDEELATSFLIKKNLLANNEQSKCHKCGSRVKYYTRLDRGKRRKVLRCKKKGCQTTQSLRKDNSFWACIDRHGRNISKLSISAQLELVYYWCQNLTVSAITSITGKSTNTVYNWMNMCQEIPLRVFEKRSKMGGIEKVIHMDYCSLKQLKDSRAGLSVPRLNTEDNFNSLENRSRTNDKKGYWVFALGDVNEKRYFLVESRDKLLLQRIIKQEITAGSIIHADKWTKHNELLIPGYTHHIINLNENSGDPITSTYIQKIENVWMPLLLFYKTRRGITPQILPKYLIEIWWRSFNKSDPFNAFLRDMEKVF